MAATDVDKFLEPAWERTDGPIHGMFGLSYASYLCIPRSALQLMPLEWQKQFVMLIEMLPETPSDYECKRRGDDGRFLYDELSDYRHTPQSVSRRLEAEILDKIRVAKPNPQET